MSDSKDNASAKDSPPEIQSARLNTSVRSSFLRPSLFSSQLSSLGAGDTKGGSGTVDDLKVNVFLKDPSDEDFNEENKADSAEIDKQKSDSLSMLTKNGLPKTNLLATTKTSIPLASNTGFVFGQNVHERVVGENIQTSSKSNNSTTVEGRCLDPSSCTASNLLFYSALQNTKTDEEDKAPKETDSKSLTEVARAYEESRAQKRKYDEVETFTGEEDEINVVDLNCKLFAFVNGNWEERGRGSLRLNDSKQTDGCARVVFRTSGNLRLLLNTKIWSGMVAQRPSQKSLRLTAMDNTGQIKIFLIMSRPNDINTIYNALTERINLHKVVAKNGVDQENGSGINLKDVENSGEPSHKKLVSENN